MMFCILPLVHKTECIFQAIKSYSCTKIQLGMLQRYANIKMLLHNTGGCIKLEENLKKSILRKLNKTIRRWPALGWGLKPSKQLPCCDLLKVIPELNSESPSSWETGCIQKGGPPLTSHTMHVPLCGIGC